MLISYQQRTRLLLSDEQFKVYRDGDLTVYINEARNQIAGESECLTDYSSLDVDDTEQQYAFTSITISPLGVSKGLDSVLNVRSGSVQIGSGFQIINPRAWEWFQIYELDQVVPDRGQPRVFAQFGQGASGSLWVNALDIPYTLFLTTTCLPIALGTDDDPEAIPLLWTIPVPFYAAWLALMSHPAPQMDPDKMMQRYQDMMTRARAGANPQTLPHIWSQGPDIADNNRYGITGRG